MTGILGSANLLNGPSQAIYVNDKSSATVATVNICNRNTERSAQVRIAVSATQSPTNTEWIEYDTTIPPRGVLERTGIWVNPGQYIVVRSNMPNVNAVAWGATKGSLVSVPSLSTPTVGTVTWNTASLGTISEYSSYNIPLSATDSNGGTVFYSLASGSTLPSGFGLSTNGILSGIAKVDGPYSFTVNASNGVNSSSRTFSGTIQNVPSSALDLVNAGITTDGVYTLFLPSVGLTSVYCLLNPIWDGGGWMLAMKAADSGTTFNYDANYWTTDNTLNTSSINQSNADAKFEVMNKFSAKDIMARWPDISSNSGQIPNVGTWTWLRNNFSGGSRRTLIDFFANAGQQTLASGVTNAKNSGAWANGIFSSQSGYGWYGFNYTDNPGGRVRWGFGWNNEGGPDSNDVSNGIGMGPNFGLYSAGDLIGCCQDTTGINRRARVEIYVR